MIKDDQIYIIELNVRASRTFPFISKVTGVNFIELFIKLLFEKNVAEVHIPKPNYIAVKVAQFSFARLTDASPTLGVEMASTGEVACFGGTVEEAYLKGVLATGGTFPKKSIFVSIGGTEKKYESLNAIKSLAKLQLPMYATKRTAKFLQENGIKVTKLYKIHENKSPSILNYFVNKKIDLVINVIGKDLKQDIVDGYQIRRTAVDNNILVITKLTQLNLLAKALATNTLETLQIKSWNEYTGR
jgi:carbamoyl-phosphate synthase large subunit